MRNTINKISLGRKIRNARTAKRMTQSELAEKIDVSTNFVGDIERGIKLPSIPTLIAICNTLKLSLDYLFSDSLDNVELQEEQLPYFTDKQLALMKNVIKTITTNFD